jgi:hypothetical protein
LNAKKDAEEVVLLTPPDPGVPKRAFSHAAFSHCSGGSTYRSERLAASLVAVLLDGFLIILRLSCHREASYKIPTQLGQRKVSETIVRHKH